MTNEMNVDYWNRLAGRFSDEVFEVTERDLNGVIRKTAKQLGGVQKSAVDFGCGAGASTRTVAPFFKRVTGVDFSEDLLSVATSKTDADNIEYRKANLATMNPRSFRCNVAFCFNVLLSPDADLRKSIAANVIKAIRIGGAGVFITPSIESELRSYQIALECQVRSGFGRAAAAKEINATARREVVSLSQGVINLGGAPTKHFFHDELADLLSECGLRDVTVSRVHYPWEDVLDDIPADMPYSQPWDWIARGKKG